MLYRLQTVCCVYTFSDDPRDGETVQLYTSCPLVHICVNIDYIQRSRLHSCQLGYDSSRSLADISCQGRMWYELVSGDENIERKFVNAIREGKQCHVVTPEVAVTTNLVKIETSSATESSHIRGSLPQLKLKQSAGVSRYGGREVLGQSGPDQSWAGRLKSLWLASPLGQHTRRKPST